MAHRRQAGVALAAAIVAALAGLVARPAAAADATPRIPVLVPLTGFLAAEGASQRNGALLALRNPPPGVAPRFAVTDTATSPEGAVNALERALSAGPVAAVVAPILGTQMLAMLPIAPRRQGAAGDDVGHRVDHGTGQSLRVPLLPGRFRGEAGAGALCDRGRPHRPSGGDHADHRLWAERACGDRPGTRRGRHQAGLSRKRSTSR